MDDTELAVGHRGAAPAKAGSIRLGFCGQLRTVRSHLLKPLEPARTSRSTELPCGSPYLRSTEAAWVHAAGDAELTRRLPQGRQPFPGGGVGHP